jgi:hypothetical protein
MQKKIAINTRMKLAPISTNPILTGAVREDLASARSEHLVAGLSLRGSRAPTPQHTIFENDLAVDGEAIAGIDLGGHPDDGLAELFKFTDVLFTVRPVRRGLVDVGVLGVRQNAILES